MFMVLDEDIEAAAETKSRLEGFEYVGKFD